MSRFSPDTVLGVILGIDNDLIDDAIEPAWVSVRPGTRSPDGAQTHATVVLTPIEDTSATETFDVQITRAG